MPAAVVKGIIISISIITALGVAVLESPQIQAWLEQQRRKLVELLRNLGEELDAESRRAAESFAYEGHTPATDEGVRREAYGSIDAAAVATGRSLSGPSAIRRIPVHGPSTPDEAEERRRQGREYLARRNQQMFELQQRRQTGAAATVGLEDEGEPASITLPTTTPSTPSTPTFDNLVDLDGKLRELEPRAIETMSDASFDAPSAPTPQRQAQAMSAFEQGARNADPFDDDYALERSVTPRPLVSVESEVERLRVFSPPVEEHPIVRTPPSEPIALSAEEQSDLTFEEQMAIALSLSEAESSPPPRHTAAVTDHDDPDLRAAIAESLREFEAISTNTGNDTRGESMLVDVSTNVGDAQHQLRQRIREWEAMLPMTPTRAQPVMATATGALSVASEATDDLYTATPRIMHSPLPEMQVLQPLPSLVEALTSVQEGRLDAAHWSRASPDASFHSAVPTNIDIAMTKAEDVPALAHAEQASDTESFASMSRAASVAGSNAQSRTSGIDMLSAAEDTDHDVLSDDDESGVLTPDSWSEVGSQDGEEGQGRNLAIQQPTEAYFC